MPRVVQPVWLTMMSGATEKNQLCGYFMRELSLLMEQASKNQLSGVSLSVQAAATAAHGKYSRENIHVHILNIRTSKSHAFAHTRTHVLYNFTSTHSQTPTLFHIHTHTRNSLTRAQMHTLKQIVALPGDGAKCRK